MRFGSEFEKYAVQHAGIGSNTLSDYSNNVGVTIPQETGMTPMIIEERKLNASVISVFDRLMLERIIWVTGGIEQRMASIVQAQLMFLDSVETKDIQIYLNSPGGSVSEGLSIVSVLEYINSDVATTNVGLAASMGSILLGAGTKGKRYSLRFSRTMLHQVSSGGSGVLADLQISLREAEKYNDILFGLLGEYSGKDPEQIKEDATRDLWLNAQETLEYGLIDEIIKPNRD